jgi:hypothetical protein
MSRQTKGFAENDVFISWRRAYCWTQRAGACKKIKRRANRRDRREAKITIYRESA